MEKKIWKTLIDPSSNGPLVTILSFIEIEELTKSTAFVNKSFYEAFKVSFIRSERGYTNSEYEKMLNLNTGIGEKLMEILLGSPKLNFNFIYPHNYKKMDLLSYSCYKEFNECFKVILQRGIKPEFKHLIISCNANNFEIVKVILEDGRLDPSQSNNYPLFRACIRNHLDIVKLLIKDKRVHEKKRELLERQVITHVSNYGLVEVLEFLLDYFEEEKYEDVGSMSLRLASENNHVEVVKILLKDKRIDPTHEQNAAFRFAAQIGNLEICKMLIEDKRVDPTVRKNFALKYACSFANLDVVRLLLLDKRIDPSCPTNSPLVRAAIGQKKVKTGDRLEIVKLLLLDDRIDPNDFNEEFNENILELIVKECNDVEIVKVILSDRRVVKMVSDGVVDVDNLVEIATKARNLVVAKYLLSIVVE